MIPEIGHFALILALAMALAQSVLPLIGAANGNAAWMALARPSARAQFGFMLIAYACLTWAFMTDDFSVALAANHSNSMLPAAYKFTAVWGNHEGSILLWSLILSGWTCAVTFFSKPLDERTQARVLGVMGWSACGFMLFTLLTSNPFERLLPAAADGQDLNPLLQDPGMVLHPPLLYMGYVGFSGRLCLCRDRAAVGAAGRRLGALVAALDHGRLVLPHAGHRARQLLGLLRARLGRLVVLGPGGERLLHALAGGHRADALAGRDRKARRLRMPGPCCWRSWRSRCRCWAPSSCARACSARCTPLPPTRRAACSSSASWRWWWAARCCCSPGARPKSAPAAASSGCRANRCCWPTTCCCWWRRRRCCWARCTRWCWTRWGWARSRSARPTSTPCSCR
jgi:hypothetical protein